MHTADDEAPSPDFFFGARKTGEDVVASVGDSLADGIKPASHDELLEALRGVYDPELPVNIVELGLIYRLDVDDKGDVFVDMTLTAPACPVAGEMPRMVAETLSNVEGAGRAEVRLVWEPAWTQERMSEDARLALGLF